MVIAAWTFAEPVWSLLTPDPALRQAGMDAQMVTDKRPDGLDIALHIRTK